MSKAAWQQDEAFLAYLSTDFNPKTARDLAAATPDGPFVKGLGIDQRYKDFCAGRQADR